MNANFNYAAFKPYGLVAFSIWVFGVLSPEYLGASDKVGIFIFIFGFVVFFFGTMRGLKSKK